MSDIRDPQIEPRNFKVASVDDHRIVSNAISAMIDQLSEVTFVGSATTVSGLISMGPLPDLIVLDIRLGDGSSLTSNVATLHELGAKVLVFTSGENRHQLMTAARADVLGIISKSAPESEFLLAISNAAAGRQIISSDWASAVDSDPSLEAANLTSQEKLVLEKYAGGSAAKTVAFDLGISEHTVEEFLKRIKIKYARAGRGSSTKIDLYKRALEDGFLPLPGN